MMYCPVSLLFPLPSFPLLLPISNLPVSPFPPPPPYYRIVPNVRGTKVSQIGIFKHYAETIFANQGYRVLVLWHSEKIWWSLISQLQLIRKNRENYAPRNLALYVPSPSSLPLFPPRTRFYHAMWLKSGEERGGTLNRATLLLSLV